MQFSSQLTQLTLASLPPSLPFLGVTPLARVRCNQPDKIHFLLDAGALGIVCPLINTAQVGREGGREGGREADSGISDLINDSTSLLSFPFYRKSVISSLRVVTPL